MDVNILLFVNFDRLLYFDFFDKTVSDDFIWNEFETCYDPFKNLFEGKWKGKKKSFVFIIFKIYSNLKYRKTVKLSFIYHSFFFLDKLIVKLFYFLLLAITSFTALGALWTSIVSMPKSIFQLFFTSKMNELFFSLWSSICNFSSNSELILEVYVLFKMLILFRNFQLYLKLLIFHLLR